jgi:chromosome segregation protein
MSVLQLTETGKAHASLIEKLLSQWMNARYLEQNATFEPQLARQIKASALSKKSSQLTLMPFSNWIKTPQFRYGKISGWQMI